jgi:hypothetical protein
MIDRTDTQWYRDALIYQVHVKSFFDSNNDGVGDFRGVTEKLDYIRDLGVTADLADAVLSLAAEGRRLRHPGLPRHQPVLRDDGGLQELRGRGARSAVSGS